MVTPLPIDQFAYNSGAQRWVNVGTRRFIPESRVIGEMRRHQAATFNTLQRLSEQLYSGSISIGQWQLGVASELKDAHLAQSMFAVGGRENMTQANFGRVGGTLANEYTFLNQFAQDIEAGKVSKAQAQARIRQYGKATQQSYWREFSAASKNLLDWVLSIVDNCRATAGALGCVELSQGGPYTARSLPTVPGAGATTCRGNCSCSIERRS
jgi:hypothetical protein